MKKAKNTPIKKGTILYRMIFDTLPDGLRHISEYVVEGISNTHYISIKDGTNAADQRVSLVRVSDTDKYFPTRVAPYKSMLREDQGWYRSREEATNAMLKKAAIMEKELVGELERLRMLMDILQEGNEAELKRYKVIR